jgi:glycosyltransferase involved in cell wall biosynthesis
MKKKNILMIVENIFPGDSRVRKEAEALRQQYAVSVIALKKNKSEKMYEVHNDIRIFRIPEFPALRMGKLRYIFEYGYFTLCAALIFIFSYPLKRYKVIHVHNPPDTLFLVGLLGKLFFVKFIYDHHDLAPELYLTRFGGRKDLIYKVLLVSERFSCKLADAIISTNESYKVIETGRHNVNKEKIFVVRNNPLIKECLDEKKQRPASKTSSDRNVLLFLGSINPQDGVDTLLRVLHYLVHDLKTDDFVCNIVGDGDSAPHLKQLADELALNSHVFFKGQILDREKIKEYLASCDIGVEPAPENELNKHSTFIKIMEYMAAVKPIVAFDLVETRYSANGSALLVPPGDLPGFARALKRLFDEPRLRDKLGAAGLERVEKELNWGKASLNLIEAYKSLSL